MRGATLGGMILFALALSAAHAGGLPATTDSDKCRIIRSDIARYLATGHPCACPYSINRAGRACGGHRHGRGLAELHRDAT